MNNVTLNIKKDDVYNEVAQTTSYAGKKMDGDDKAYERIFATKSDRSMLERFWDESCNAATDTFKPFIVTVSNKVTITNEDKTTSEVEGYSVRLLLSSMFDTNLQGSIEASLFSFFVASIVAKWCKFTDKQETESYTNDAESSMRDIKSKIYYRKKPTRMAPPVG